MLEIKFVNHRDEKIYEKIIDDNGKCYDNNTLEKEKTLVEITKLTNSEVEMKREDFIEFRDSFLKSCERIVEDNGVCFNINSCNCPFSAFNSSNGLSCSENGYHESLLNSAKEYIDLYSKIKEK